MSAFIVNDRHISAMIHTVTMTNRTGYYYNGERHDMNGKWQELGQKLVDENYRSVNYRYSENEQPHQFKRERVDRVSPVQLIKLCDCYRYQACETPNWEQTEAHAIVTAIRERAIKNLPGYEDASWELPAF